MTPENFDKATILNTEINRIKRQIDNTNEEAHIIKIVNDSSNSAFTVCTDPEIIPIIADFIRKQLELKLVELQNEFENL